MGDQDRAPGGSKVGCHVLIRDRRFVLALAVVVGPALGCAVPCVDDGFLGMQHDAACKASNTDATTSSTSGATTTSGAASTSGATSEATTTNDTTANDTSTGTSEGTTATATSTTGGAVCGDGVVEPGEQCDDGAGNGDDRACKLDCSAQVCGDGALGPGEGCDDGDVQDGDGCDANCVLESCGDNKLDDGEACDDGQNGDPDDGCTDLCTLPICGDGLLQPSTGEACDDGVDNGDAKACKLDCSLQVCGDGALGPGEGCDDGNLQDGDGCNASCVLESCGDNKVDVGEGCDDGQNGDQDDGCTDLCALPVCGDGFVQASEGEACDDGANNKDDGACTLACQAAACGDGLVHAGVEACDDGNMVQTDACLNTCANAKCGDSVVQAGVEVCDDGNLVDFDGCDGDCTVSFQMSLIGQRSCALLKSGMVRCWGFGGAVLGLGTMSPNLGDNPGELPTPDLALGGVSVGIRGGNSAYCALRDTGVVRCWGDNFFGQLGINSTAKIGLNPGDMPPADSLVGKPAVQLGGGGSGVNGGTFCAITSDGELRCWGGNATGMLGLGHTMVIGDDPGELPGAATPVGFVPARVYVGHFHACALSTQGKVRCWGLNDSGQLGNGATGTLGDDPGELPVADVELGGVAVELAVGLNFNCARMATGDVRCWGLNDFGQLGLGNTTNIGDDPGEMPPASVALGGPAKSIIPGFSHTCALRSDDNTVRCWGKNDFGQLGLGNTNTIGDGPGEMPPADAKIGGPALAVFGGSGSGHSCAMLAGMKLRCWGANGSGRLGLGHSNTIGDDELPSSAPFVPYE